jgi:hypothetical protein
MPADPPRQGGGPNPPFGEDFFQRIVNVHWGEVAPLHFCQFMFVSGSGEAPTTPAYDNYWGVSAVSRNGIAWTNIQPLVQIPFGSTLYSTVFTCVICRKPSASPSVIMAGGFHEYRWDDINAGITRYNEIPYSVISADGGTTWTGRAGPVYPLPATINVHGRVIAIGYNEEANSFYSTVNWFDELGVTHILTYQYSSSGLFLWSLINDQIGGDPILAYPVGTRVCDTSNSSGTDLIYCSSSGLNQIVESGGHTYACSGTVAAAILIDGVSVNVTGMGTIKSVTAGEGVILVGGLDTAVPPNSVHAMSTDNGATWQPISVLTDIYGTGQGGGYAPAFSCYCADAT